jgi:uncharacterized repeat protein (TIGR01451 family)
MVSQDVKQNTAGSGAAVEDNAEEVNQSASGGAQSQDAYQSSTVEQWASGAGKNDSQIDESQWQKAHGGLSQSQNATMGSIDCAAAFGSENPNQCANVSQVAASGTNASRLNQLIQENAKLNVVGGSQTQGLSGAGIDGRVHQDSLGGSSNDVKQSKVQEASAPPETSQTQIDPLVCCGFASQIGPGTEHIDQRSVQHASEDGAFQHSDLIGQSTSPAGSCAITQNATTNFDSESASASQSPCVMLLVVTSCSGTKSEGDCSSSTTGPPPPVSSLEKAVRNVDHIEEGFSEATTASPGDTLEYRLIYSNSGAGDAHSVIVTEPIPSGTKFVSCTMGCVVEPTKGVIIWDLGTVEPDSSVEMLFTVTVEEPCCRTITNTASVDTAEEPPMSSNPATVAVGD